jgi:16S rRNA (cytidine1402-2'-O)-methyltransferase
MLLRQLEAKPNEPETPSKAARQGALHLVGTPIGHRGDITLRALVALARADLILCEDTRVTGALLQAYGITQSLLSYHEHNAAARQDEILQRLRNGQQLVLVSDAGMPLIADPGARLVAACRQDGITVTICPGASAITTALSFGGITGGFIFVGFLPPKSHARRLALQAWQSSSLWLVAYETPQRLLASLADSLAVLGNRQAMVARELTKLFEEIQNDTIEQLIAHYQAHPPKGEIVLMLAPAIEAEPADDEAIDQCLTEALSKHSLRDAVQLVTAATGQPRDKIYQRALALRQQQVLE